MLYVKIMSDEDLSDENSNKNFTLLQVDSISALHFRKVIDDPLLQYPYELEIRATDDRALTTSYALMGNVYVMNESGKTIASHGC